MAVALKEIEVPPAHHLNVMGRASRIPHRVRVASTPLTDDL